MNIINRLTSFLLAAVVVLGLCATADAQTALTTTTTSAAITATGGTAAQYVQVTATTGITAATSGGIQDYLLIDKEIMAVRTVNTTSLVVGVVRGAQSSRAALHASGATITIVPPLAMQSWVPSGNCTRSTLLYVPLVVGGSPSLGNETGTQWDCLGVTTAANWYETSAAGGGGPLGSTVSSPAGVMTPTGLSFVVSGTNAVTGITVPAGFAPGACLTILPTGAFTTTTATNINLASTAVAKKVLFECWDGTKWNPSY